jgi:DNA-binding transcriptional regulator YiaG
MRPADISALAWVRAACESGEARSIRRAARIAQSEVASACQVTPGAVSLWEAGRRVPGGDRALAYARLLRQLQRKAA